MTTTTATLTPPPLAHTDRFFIGGEWVAASSDAQIDVIDSATEELFFSVAEAQADDIARAVDAARQAFDDGPWPHMTPAERADWIRRLGAGLAARNDVLGQLWPRESGVLASVAQYTGMIGSKTLEQYAELADTFDFEEQHKPTLSHEVGLMVRETVSVVG